MNKNGTQLQAPEMIMPWSVRVVHLSSPSDDTVTNEMTVAVTEHCDKFVRKIVKVCDKYLRGEAWTAYGNWVSELFKCCNRCRLAEDGGMTLDVAGSYQCVPLAAQDVKVKVETLAAVFVVPMQARSCSGKTHASKHDDLRIFVCIKRCTKVKGDPARAWDTNIGRNIGY